MKRLEKNYSEELLKEIFPTINWKYYRVVDFVKSQNTWENSKIYFTRMTVTIEEFTDIPEWLDKTKWYAHWFIVTTKEDRPIRDNVVTIIERRKKRKNRETSAVISSVNHWVEVLKWTTMPKDILFFLK